MTEQEKKIKKAIERLSALRNATTLELEEVGQLLSSLSPTEDKPKQRRNLRKDRMEDVAAFYRKKGI